MDKINIDIVLLFIVIAICILDILKNRKVLTLSQKIFTAGVLSYISIILFFICFIFYPTITHLLVLIAVLGSFPSIYYWYYRTTKSEKKKEAFMFIILILAGVVYYLIN